MKRRRRRRRRGRRRRRNIIRKRKGRRAIGHDTYNTHVYAQYFTCHEHVNMYVFHSYILKAFLLVVFTQVLSRRGVGRRNRPIASAAVLLPRLCIERQAWCDGEEQRRLRRRKRRRRRSRRSRRLL